MQGASSSGAQVLAFALKKGGVGKTVVSFHTAIFLANMGKRVLLIDAEQQGNATRAILGKNQHTGTDGNGKTYFKFELFSLIQSYVQTDDPQLRLPLQAVILPTKYQTLDIIPTWTELGMLQAAAPSLQVNGYAVSDIIADIKAMGFYDYIIFDTAPGYSKLEEAVMETCDYVCPITTGRAFAEEGYGLLVKIIDNLQRRKGLSVNIPFIVLNMVNMSMKSDKQTREQLSRLKLEGFFKEVFFIPSDQNITNFINEGINAYDKHTEASRALRDVAFYIAENLSKEAAHA